MCEDVEPRTQTSRDELRHERSLVHDLAARRVDEARAVTEQRKAPRIDETARLRGQRRMDADDGRLGEQRIELAVLAEHRDQARSLRVEHAQLESLRPPGDGLADAPEPDDAKGRAGQLLGNDSVGPLRPPLADSD